MPVSDRSDNGGGGDRSGAGDRSQAGEACIKGCGPVQLATVPEHSAVQSHELVAEVTHNISREVGKIVFCSFQTPLGKGNGMAGALPNNNPQLSQNTTEHVHDLRPLTDN